MFKNLVVGKFIKRKNVQIRIETFKVLLIENKQKSIIIEMIRTMYPLFIVPQNQDERNLNCS